MIWLSLKREKWVYASSNQIYALVPVEQSNKKPIHRKDTEFKQGRLEVFKLPVGNSYQTLYIIMRFFHLLKGGLNIPIITALLIWIATICHINVIEPLKSTNIILVGQLEPTHPIKWTKWWKYQLRKLDLTKNMIPDVLNHHQKGVLVLLDTRRYGSWSNCNCDRDVSKIRQTFHEPYTRVYIMV